MSALILLIALAAVPFVAAIAFRLNAIYLFTSVAAGALLSAQWGQDLETMIGGFSKYNHVDVVARLILLLLPVVLCFLFLRRSMPKSQMPLQLVPTGAVCISLAIMIVNLLPKDIQKQLYGTTVGSQAQKLQDIIMAGTAVLILILMYATVRHKKEHGKKHHKH